MISKILFVCDNMPFSSNFNGASSFKYSHLKLLVETLPNAKIYIYVLDYNKGFEFNIEDFTKDYPNSNIEIHKLNLLDNTASNTKRKRQILAVGIQKIKFFHNYINNKNINAFKQKVKEINPDLIWTENIIENYFALQVATIVPIIYSHYDFLWKLRKIKGVHTLIGNLKNLLLKRIEELIIKKNGYIISGSTTEIAEIKLLNPKSIIEVFPTNYQSIDTKLLKQYPTIKIVHLGTMKATANKIGLVRFMRECWPALNKLQISPQLLIIGDLEGASNELLSYLSHPNVQCLGYIKNLETVLNPYDIHIIPYEYDTGTRTRVSLVLNYRQVLISTVNASKGVKGLEHMYNCILVNNLTEMTQQIMKVINNQIDYKRIADNGKVLFEKDFTVKGQKKKMEDFLKRIEQRI